MPASLAFVFLLLDTVSYCYLAVFGDFGLGDVLECHVETVTIAYAGIDHSEATFAQHLTHLILSLENRVPLQWRGSCLRWRQACPYTIG